MSQLPDRVGVDQEDIDAITKAALDYLEGYVSADAERHLGSYHPEAIKRRYTQDEDGVFGIISLSPQTMADSAALQTPSEIEAEIVIDGVYNDIASVRVYSSRWVDFLHMAKARGEWRLFQVTWHPRNTATE